MPVQFGVQRNNPHRVQQPIDLQYVLFALAAAGRCAEQFSLDSEYIGEQSNLCLRVVTCRQLLGSGCSQ